MQNLFGLADLDFENLFAFGSIGYGCAEFGDLVTVVNQINTAGASYQTYYDAFWALAQRTRALADRELAAGHTASARSAYLRFLCREQVPDPLAESCFRDGDYVVAVHHRFVPESVGLPDRDLGGQAARRGGDWRDGDLRSLRDDHVSGEDQDRACLVQVCDVNGPH
jgi:hypothetical protein